MRGLIIGRWPLGLLQRRVNSPSVCAVDGCRGPRQPSPCAVSDDARWPHPHGISLQPPRPSTLGAQLELRPHYVPTYPLAVPSPPHNTHLYHGSPGCCHNPRPCLYPSFLPLGELSIHKRCGAYSGQQQRCSRPYRCLRWLRYTCARWAIIRSSSIHPSPSLRAIRLLSARLALTATLRTSSVTSSPTALQRTAGAPARPALVARTAPHRPAVHLQMGRTEHPGPVNTASVRKVGKVSTAISVRRTAYAVPLRLREQMESATKEA